MRKKSQQIECQTFYIPKRYQSFLFVLLRFLKKMKIRISKTIINPEYKRTDNIGKTPTTGATELFFNTVVSFKPGSLICTEFESVVCTLDLAIAFSSFVAE